LLFGEQRAPTHPNTHPMAQYFSRYANVGRPLSVSDDWERIRYAIYLSQNDA